jgi:hypothetical protein
MRPAVIADAIQRSWLPAGVGSSTCGQAALAQTKLHRDGLPARVSGTGVPERSSGATKKAGAAPLFLLPSVAPLEAIQLPCAMVLAPAPRCVRIEFQQTGRIRGLSGWRFETCLSVAA